MLNIMALYVYVLYVSFLVKYKLCMCTAQCCKICKIWQYNYKTLDGSLELYIKTCAMCTEICLF